MNGGDGGELVVLMSFPAPQRVNNPYTSLLLDALRDQPGITARTFSWRFALTGRYDVLHLHWPETLIERRRRHTTAVRQVCFALLLIRCVLLRTAVVRTVHNLELPQGLPRHQRALLRLAERVTTSRILINESTSDRTGSVVESIPHGHYRDWYRTDDEVLAVPGRLAFFGRIRRYKRADLLVRAFSALPREIEYSLRIAGRASSEDLADELRSLAGDDPRIDLQFEFLDDDDMVRLVREAELVVLPYPEMHNSGTVLAALSLDRPVLVCDNEANRLLADEVGPGWVLRYREDLSATDIAAALDEVRVPGRTRPNLNRRDWAESGRRHARAYRYAVGSTRGRSRISRISAR